MIPRLQFPAGKYRLRQLARLFLWLLLLPARAHAAPEDTLAVSPAHPALYLEENYYSMLEDPTGRLRLADVQSPAWSRRFVVLRGSGHPPNIQHPRSTYWLRITVRHAPAENAA